MIMSVKSTCQLGISDLFGDWLVTVSLKINKQWYPPHTHTYILKTTPSKISSQKSLTRGRRDSCKRTTNLFCTFTVLITQNFFSPESVPIFLNHNCRPSFEITSRNESYFVHAPTNTSHVWPLHATWVFNENRFGSLISAAVFTIPQPLWKLISEYYSVL